MPIQPCRSARAAPLDPFRIPVWPPPAHHVALETTPQLQACHSALHALRASMPPRCALAARTALRESTLLPCLRTALPHACSAWAQEFHRQGCSPARSVLWTGQCNPLCMTCVLLRRAQLGRYPNGRWLPTTTESTTWVACFAAPLLLSTLFSKTALHLDPARRAPLARQEKRIPSRTAHLKWTLLVRYAQHVCRAQTTTRPTAPGLSGLNARHAFRHA